MNPKTIVGIVLIALGIVAFAYQGITYTTRGRDVDIGPFHMTTERSHHIPLPPLLGGIALVGGVVLMLAGRKGLGRAVTP